MAMDGDITFTWYGHACVEVGTPGGRTVLIDPWFGNPRSPNVGPAAVVFTEFWAAVPGGKNCDARLATDGPDPNDIGDTPAENMITGSPTA